MLIVRQQASRGDEERRKAMIRREDFQIDICQSPAGATVHVRHLPTGKEQVENGVQDSDVGQVRDRLVRKVEGELFHEDDFETRIGRADGGDFLQVIHLPSGKSRLECPLGRRSQGFLARKMIDSILEEIFREAKKEASKQ